jgi:hypothetical protein
MPAAQAGAPATALSSELRTSRERRRRSGLTACSGHGGHPITAPLAVRNDLTLCGSGPRPLLSPTA